MELELKKSLYFPQEKNEVGDVNKASETACALNKGNNKITELRTPEPLNRNESGRLGALKSDSTHHFFRNACTKSGSLRFSQFSGC
jgi:hypothetical protein